MAFIRSPLLLSSFPRRAPLVAAALTVCALLAAAPVAAQQPSPGNTEFRVDKKSGHLTATGMTGDINTPGGMYFLKVE